MAMEIRDELDDLDLGDRRLNERGRKLVETLFADPAARINAACHGWNETQAAYRFFNNDQISPEEILVPHQQATRDRIAQHPVVLVAQDTTELDYSTPPPAGAGPLNSLKQRGFLDRSHIAFTPAGLCLGMVDVDIWARSDEGFGNSKPRQHDPLETKEKFRWVKGYRKACDLQRQIPGTQIVSVADSEGDLYEVFLEVDRQGAGAADYVIRAGKTRSLPERDPDAGPYAYRKLQQEIAEAPVRTVRQLDLPRTPQREPRTATLEIRAKRVLVKAPYRKHIRTGPLPKSVTQQNHLDANEWWLADLAAKLEMPIATLHRWQRVGWVTSRKIPAAGNRWAIFADAEELARLERLRNAPRGWPAPYPPELITPKPKPLSPGVEPS